MSSAAACPELILQSRRSLPRPAEETRRKAEAEGGCGVIGMVSTLPVAGRHLFSACSRMRNRGNGKGGGIAAAGLDAAALGVPQEVLDQDYLIAVAYLDPKARPAVEKEFIEPFFDVSASGAFASLQDHREVPGLELRPPEVRRYFARVKPAVLDRFMAEHAGAGALERGARERWEDEFVYQNSYRLNARRYSSQGAKEAFVLSHAKDLLVLKLVGYAEDALRFYRLEDFKAKLWIGHQRYPTKGRVWHPGGAHPFIGMHEALVHNGDFANYTRVTRYLRQRGIRPQFLTDTEVSVQLFDLWTRVYGYPLEYALEAMAPTTERDFDLLPPSRREAYRAIQAATIKGSPDGPWFFIIARRDRRTRELQLIGVTDTSMLRPQVFALKARGVDSIGLIASEKQAVDAALSSLGAPFEGPADRYWNARGGSYSDGGAFIFRVPADGRMRVADKFGKTVDARGIDFKLALAVQKTREGLDRLGAAERRVGRADMESLPAPRGAASALAVDASGLPIEGPRSAAALIVAAHRLGWRRFILHNLSGHRFLGCGLGPRAQAEFDCYGSPGDYLGSGLDGSTMRVYNNGQDQLGQILKSGKLVVYGDVGQTFMYGAKGGEAYVLGGAAGRPLINAVGNPRVVINGTCLDYLGESFMAGDPLKGGGFVVLNGIRYMGAGAFEDLETPYPGGNLFSLASGGAIYIRDPGRQVGEDQLNGGRIDAVSTADWELIRPYLEENERLFGISVDGLLRRGGLRMSPEQAYIKIVPTRLRALTVAHD